MLRGRARHQAVSARGSSSDLPFRWVFRGFRGAPLGETVQSVARACLVQFENIKPTESLWTLVRTEGQVEKVITGIEANPGFVLYTLVDATIQNTPSQYLVLAYYDLNEAVIHGYSEK